MIDLHLHTTASDGTDSPSELVAACKAAGLTTIAVTDHDTTAGIEGSGAAARAAGLAFVPGIEITAAWRERDVHVLGYFVDHRSARLEAFLTEQREDRIRRARDIAERLAALGAPIDMEGLIARTKGRPVLRPHIAEALVAAGHVADEQAAFDRFIAEGRPAFIPRDGATPADVVRVIREAGGLSSLAHPGITREDALIPGMVAAGLDAIEVFHADHTDDDVARYRHWAATLGLTVTGGSDYHGARSHHTHGFGIVGLPEADFEALLRRAARTARDGGIRPAHRERS
jgi:3',5'-nucleoside bisphosphate phosphatase